MDRRAFLTVTMGVGLSGCVAESAPRASPETRSSRPESKLPSESARCRGEPVSVGQSLTDAPGYDDDFWFFPTNETVRIVVARNGDGPALFETISFEEWASIECAQAGLRRVHDATAIRLGTDEFNSGIGDPPGFFSSETSVIRLAVATYVQANGTENTPTVSLSRLVRVAPRSVDMTVSIKDESFSRTIPVLAERLKIAAR